MVKGHKRDGGSRREVDKLETEKKDRKIEEIEVERKTRWIER